MSEIVEPIRRDEVDAGGQGTERRIEIALLLRGISEAQWEASLERGITDSATEAVRPETDMGLLSEIVGREFTVRLGRAIAENVGLTFDLRFRAMEVTRARPVRVLRMTVRWSDAGLVYAWLVRLIPPNQKERPPAAETLGPWDWGGNLDSIVRRTFPSEKRGISGYGGIFRTMSHDGFIAAAAVMAARNSNVRWVEGRFEQNVMH